MVRGNWWCKIGVVESIENLGSELHVKIFGDLRDVIVLEHRKIHLRYPRADEDVAPGVAAQVEALRRRSDTMVFCPICRICNGRNCETFVLNVSAGGGRVFLGFSFRGPHHNWVCTTA